jgi:quinol monooxygenase YgiN
MAKLALLGLLEAKAGKENDVEQFLRGGAQLAQQEPGTVSWFAFRMGDRKFGIFDTFNDEAGRQAHVSGKIAEALFAKAPELFSQPPRIEKLDILGEK